MCSDPPTGFDITFFGKAFKSYLDQPKSYMDALETCRNDGGNLANIRTEEDFLAARVMAGNGQRTCTLKHLHYKILKHVFLPTNKGFSTEPMWLGMMTNANTLCNDASSCSGKVNHHGPGENEASTFQDPGWITVDMELDSTSTQYCVTMAHADASSNYNQLSSLGCGTAAPFVCVAECNQGIHTTMQYIVCSFFMSTIENI